MPYNKEYQKNYRKNRPKSATTPENYLFYVFLLTLTDAELMVLFKKRKVECKYADNNRIKQLRTEMSIINDVLEQTKQTI